MTKAALKENVESLIIKVKTKEALESIKKFLTNTGQDHSQLDNAILMQMATLSRANQEKINGLISDGSFNQIIAKVNYATLEIVKQINEGETSEPGGKAGNGDLSSNNHDFESGNDGGKSVQSQDKIKILFLSANPKDTIQLRLNNEIRYVKNGFTSATLRDKFEFISEPAVTLPDITQAMMKHKPQIVHFSGHGSGKQGLIIEDRDGSSKYFTTEALSALFKLFKNRVECTLLNACYSEEQAIAISREGVSSKNKNEGIYAVGMNDEVGDKAAIDFSVGFYQAIGEGYDYKFAFNMGLVHINAIATANKPEIWFNGSKITDM